MVLSFYRSRAWRQCWSSGPKYPKKTLVHLWFTFAFCFDWPGSFGEEQILENNGHMHVYSPRGRADTPGVKMFALTRGATKHDFSGQFFSYF